MTRLQQKLFDKKSLIVFITAGDPDIDTTLDIMRAMAREGVDCIELGMPFSDPIADGPVIQRATARALAQNAGISQIFELVKRFRTEYDTPVVLMGYLNPVLRIGSEHFIQRARAAGVDGLIIADLPYEEGEDLESLCAKYGMALIYILAPELSTERTKAILNASTGFVYCVAQYGTTGSASRQMNGLQSVIESMRPFTDKPIMVGFGISSLDRAAQISRFSDGVIIGSWLIKELEKASDKAGRAAEMVRELKNAIG
ncbi:tryptophan synthase subunit alpha [candidate division KSB1 bacterium]|nr:tryptophan synthase subunit alpha [candidate division KSB1 bacterium]